MSFYIEVRKCNVASLDVNNFNGIEHEPRRTDKMVGIENLKAHFI